MSSNNTKKIRDLPVRLFHWLLVIAIGVAYYSVEFSGNMDHHFYAGYVVLTLIAFRIMWGFFGTRYARFSSFFFPISEIKAYASKMLQKNSTPHAGHNPLGALSAIALMLVVLFQAVSGLFASDGDFLFGPLSEKISYSLSDTITELHELNMNLIWGLAGLHLAAVLFYQFFKKQNIIGAMFSGRKKELDGDTEEIANSKLKLAVPMVAAMAAVVYWISQQGY